MKRNQGITLVALVITIIILIILATVAISFAFGENGLINRAQDASKMYANDTAYTEGSIANVEAFINDILIGTGGTQTPSSGSELEQAKASGKVFAEKDEPIEDAEGNKIKVPEGFKIASDSGNTVEQGVVIEDVSASTDATVQESQFVWVPVGVFTKDGGTSSNEIVLGRYTFATDAQGTPTLQQAAYTNELPENYKTSKPIESYYDEYSGEHRDGILSEGLDGLNASANDLEAWVESVKKYGGYYIGRYEASFASGTSIENYKAATKISSGVRNADDGSMLYSQGTLWNYISQQYASKVAINTYAESTSVKSDLVNSYAWDTAIVFLQECGHTNYANKNGTDINPDLVNTGTVKDEVCKINDMAANLREWTTEYTSYNDYGYGYPCTIRGGAHFFNEFYTALRGTGGGDAGGSGIRLSFNFIYAIMK